MHIDYSIKHIKCHGAHTGFICINNIQLNKQEQYKYGHNYTIVWSSNIAHTNLSRNSLVAKNLPAGLYTFQIFGNGYFSPEYNIEIIESAPISIDNLKIIQENPNQPAKFSCDIIGGHAPYILNYGKYSTSTSDHVEFDIHSTVNDCIRIQDAHGCVFKSESIETAIYTAQVSTISQLPPIIYDDHLQSFIFKVQSNLQHYYINIIDEKNSVITISSQDTKYHTYSTNNLIYYDVGCLLYPGTYTLQIVDHNNSIYQSLPIQCVNTTPLAVDIAVVNDNIVGASFRCDIHPILDSLMIRSTSQTVLDTSIGNTLSILVDGVVYKQKIINTEQFNDYTVLQLSPGFNFHQNKQILFATIQLNINDQPHTITVGSFKDDLCLVRYHPVIVAPQKIQLKSAKNINLSTNDLNTNAYIYNHQEYYNTYIVGNCLCVYLQQNNTILDLLNQYESELFCYSLDHTSHTGSISVNVKTGTAIANQDQYNITYYYYNPYTNKTSKLLWNNHTLRFNQALFLQSGLYIIRIQDVSNNPIKYINTLTYDAHYEAAINYLKEHQMNLTEYKYGDILVQICDQNHIAPNIFGLDPEPIIKTQSVSQPNLLLGFDQIKSTCNSCHNSLKIISQPANIRLHIYGPNNFSDSIEHKTQYTNLEPGVYSIVGDDIDLKNKYLYQNSKDIIVGKNTDNTIIIAFNSYQYSYTLGMET